MASDDLKGKRSILWGGALRNGTAERREGGQASSRDSHQGKQLCFLQDMGKGKPKKKKENLAALSGARYLDSL